MFKCSKGPGLGPQGKLERLCVGSLNNCFRKFVPFFNGSGKKAIFIYISPATSIYKFKWVVISCVAYYYYDIFEKGLDLVTVCDAIMTLRQGNLRAVTKHHTNLLKFRSRSKDFFTFFFNF